MTKVISILSTIVLSFLLVLLEQTSFVEQRTPLFSFISVLAYSTLGTGLLFAAYKFIDWLIPANVEKEIFEKQNLAAAVFKGMLLLGIALIIGMVIVSP